ncbi:armadillo-type protein, partial [Thamnocephalis sphaerospora]
EQANRWLEEFQNTVTAWNIADILLRDGTANLEARLFAAQTFRKKVTYDLHQLDTAARLSLRDSMLDLMAQFKSGPAVLVTQLCLALSALAMQLPQWTGVVPQMMKLFGADPQSATCLLEFLTILPEEVNGNHRIPITDDEFAERSRELLTDTASEVFHALLLYMQTSGTNTALQNRVFKCLLSWIRSGDIPIMEISNSPLLDMVFGAVQNDELFEVAVDLICEIIHETREVEECMPVIEQIYPKLLGLRPMIPGAADDSDQLRGLCRMFTEAGEAYVTLVVTHVDAFRGILEGVLECITMHDLDIVKMTFNFWYSLTQCLDTERHESVKPRFVDVFRRLIELIIQHLHYPADLSNWLAEERDEFRDFRHEMGDVLKDCCVVLGVKEALAIPCHQLEGLLANPASPWQKIEAPLFSLRAMGSEVPVNEADMMPRIMSMLSQLPDHPKIRYAAILVIARYTQWTSEHPQFIDYQMNLISNGFDNDDVAAASAMALKYLCKDCNKLLVSYLGMLHPFYVNASKTLNRDDLLEVTEALSHVIAAVPLPELLKMLQTFCLPVCQELHAVASKLGQTTDSELRKVADLLEQLAVFLGVVSPEVPPDQVHPCLTLVKDLMPIFDQLQTHHGATASISEALCKCYTACAESYGTHFRPMLPQLMERLGTAFSATGLSCYLWVARKCIRSLDGASDTASMAMAFSPRFQMASGQTLLCACGDLLLTYSRYTATTVVEEYFRLMLVFHQDYPTALLRSPMLSSVFQCAMACLAVGQAYPLIAVLDFIREILARGLPTSVIAEFTPTDRAAVHALVQEHGKALVALLMDGALHSFPRDMVQDVAIILEITAQLVPGECTVWVAAEIGKIPDSRLAPAKRDRFMQEYSSAIQNETWRRLRRLLNDVVAYYWRQNTRAGDAARA